MKKSLRFVIVLCLVFAVTSAIPKILQAKWECDSCLPFDDNGLIRFQPQFGLYFLDREKLATKPLADRKRINSLGMDERFFDPALPTVILIHGMDRREDVDVGNEGDDLCPGENDWDIHTANISAAQKLVRAREFIGEQNIAIFDWKAYAADTYGNVQKKIWGELHPDWDPKTTMRWRVCGEEKWTQSALQNTCQSIPHLLLREYWELIESYRAGNEYDPDIEIIGISFGAHISMRFTRLLQNSKRSYYPSTSYNPGRVVMLDPVIYDWNVYREDPGSMEIIEKFTQEFLAIEESGTVPIELFKSTLGFEQSALASSDHLLYWYATPHSAPALSKEISGAYFEMARNGYDVVWKIDPWVPHPGQHMKIWGWYFDEYIGIKQDLKNKVIDVKPARYCEHLGWYYFYAEMLDIPGIYSKVWDDNNQCFNICEMPTELPEHAPLFNRCKHFFWY